MNRGAWQATVHGIAESDMTEQLSTQYFLSFVQKLKKREHFLTHSIKPALLWYKKQTKNSQENKTKEQYPL